MKQLQIFTSLFIVTFLFFTFSINASTLKSVELVKPGDEINIQEKKTEMPDSNRIKIDPVHKNFEPRFIEPDGKNDPRFIQTSDSSTSRQKNPLFRFNRNKSETSINLNDPGIISYKKKKLSGGREKIIIVRKKDN